MEELCCNFLCMEMVFNTTVKLLSCTYQLRILSLRTCRMAFLIHQTSQKIGVVCFPFSLSSSQTTLHLQIKVLIVLTVKITVSCNVTCSLIDFYQCLKRNPLPPYSR